MNMMVSPVSGLTDTGSLEVRLARGAAEIRAAQHLRYQVFYEEMGALPSPVMEAERRDFDAYDAVADHLLVIDHARAAGVSVIGTYRLIRSDAARLVGRFYSEGEFDISALLDFDGNLLELGRSCVHQDYRRRSTLQLLWQGIAAYIRRHDIGLMFGCASLPCAEPERLAPQLAYLHHNHLAPAALRARALGGRHVPMAGSIANHGDQRRALADLPPLLKGYLRLGGYIGDGAVVDRQFNTTDVCVVLPTGGVTAKYLRHYDLDASSQGCH